MYISLIIILWYTNVFIASVEIWLDLIFGLMPLTNLHRDSSSKFGVQGGNPNIKAKPNCYLDYKVIIKIPMYDNLGIYHTVNNIFICFILTEWATEAEIPGNS